MEEFKLILQKLGEIEQKINELDFRLNKRIDDLDTKLNKMFNTLNDKIDNLDIKLSNQLNVIESKVDHNHMEMNRLTDDMMTIVYKNVYTKEASDETFVRVDELNSVSININRN